MGFTDSRVLYSAQKLNGTSLIQTGKKNVEKKKKNERLKMKKKTFKSQMTCLKHKQKAED